MPRKLLRKFIYPVWLTVKFRNLEKVWSNYAMVMLLSLTTRDFKRFIKIAGIIAALLATGTVYFFQRVKSPNVNGVKNNAIEINGNDNHIETGTEINIENYFEELNDSTSVHINPK